MRNLRLAPKLTLVFVLFAAAALGGLAYLVYARGQEGLEAATAAELTSRAAEKEAALEGWFETQAAEVEALGGQAIRENAVMYDSLVRAALAGTGAARDTGLTRARAVLRQLHVTRENYHMVDDEFQLPVLAARYLTDSAVPAERKRSFLLEAAPGRPASERPM